MANPPRDTAELVRLAIEDDPVVKQALQRGLVNVSALGREIQGSVRSGTSLEAIISAVHRDPTQAAQEPAPVGRFIARLSLRDKLTAFGITNTEQSWRAISKLPEKVAASRGDVLRIIRGEEATTVIIDSKNAKVLLPTVPKENLVRTYENLAEVVAHLEESSWESTGVLSSLATQLTLNGVNIYYHFGFGPPPSIVFEVHEDSAVKAYQALSRLRKAARGRFQTDETR